MSRLPSRSRNRRAERGSITVEFAVCIVILIMFTFAIAQYGLIFNTMNNLSMISRETARYAAVHYGDPNFYASASTAGSLRAYVQQVTANSGVVKFSDLVFTTGTGSANWYYCANPTNSADAQNGTQQACGAGNAMQITFTYDMSKKFFAPGLVPGLPKSGSMPVTRTSTVLME